MSAPALSAAEHARLLRLLGVQPLVLRRAPASTARGAGAVPLSAARDAPAPTAPAPGPPAAALPLIVLLPQGAAGDMRQQTLLRAALTSLPAALQRAPCVELDAHAGMLPAAQAYLVLGARTMAMLDGRLPLPVQRRACIAAADTPAEMLAQPARKRALWRALKQIRRTFADPR